MHDQIDPLRKHHLAVGTGERHFRQVVHVVHRQHKQCLEGRLANLTLMQFAEHRRSLVLDLFVLKQFEFGYSRENAQIAEEGHSTHVAVDVSHQVSSSRDFFTANTATFFFVRVRIWRQRMGA